MERGNGDEGDREREMHQRQRVASPFSVQILGLDSDTNYNIEVYAEQISTHLLSKSVDLSFTTKRASM